MANLYSLDLESSSTQYASIADASQTGLDLATSFTFECWCNIESLPSNGTNAMFFAKYGTVGNLGFYWSIYNNAGTYQMKVSWSSDGTASDTHTLNLTTPTLATWIHFAVAINLSAHTAYFYKNGALLGSDSTGTITTINNNNQAFYVGALNQGGISSLYDGLLDELRVWAVQRSDADILGNMRKDVTGQTGLKAYWKLENGYTDASGNGNTLTATGSPVFSSSVPFANYDAGGAFLFNLA